MIEVSCSCNQYSIWICQWFNEVFVFVIHEGFVLKKIFLIFWLRNSLQTSTKIRRKDSQALMPDWGRSRLCAPAWNPFLRPLRLLQGTICSNENVGPLKDDKALSLTTKSWWSMGNDHPTKPASSTFLMFCVASNHSMKLLAVFFKRSGAFNTLSNASGFTSRRHLTTFLLQHLYFHYLQNSVKIHREVKSTFPSESSTK